jgi:hypothetical protein
MLLHFRRMQMQPDVAGDHQDPVARRVLVSVPEDRLPGLRIGYLAFRFVPVKLSHPLPPKLHGAAVKKGAHSNLSKNREKIKALRQCTRDHARNPA